MEQKIKKFIDRKDLILSQGLDENKEINYVIFSKMLTAKEKEFAVFQAIGISYSTIEYIQSIPIEELKKLEKLAKIHQLKYQLQELEKEI